MLNPTVTFLLFLGCGGRKGREHQKLKHLLPGHTGESEFKSCNLRLSAQVQLNHLVLSGLTLSRGEA